MVGAVRPGEHACSRLAHEKDRERLAIGYVQSALVRCHKVIYLAAGLDGGQLSVRPAEDVYVVVRGAHRPCLDLSPSAVRAGSPHADQQRGMDEMRERHLLDLDDRDPVPMRARVDRARERRGADVLER